MQHISFNDPQTTLAALFCEWPDMVQVFLDRGMLCPGCPIAPFHTISDACAEYGLEEAKFRAELIAARRESPKD
jgi:hybrid cluster-associated redox disulfide protein